MRKILFLTLIILAAAVISMAADRKFTLVIDAGHGGKDSGAKGKISYEKDINLKVALAFGQYVERNCSDVKVIYTRKTDVFIQLEERANIANRNKADLFISVHTNALEGGRISRGLETYTLGMHRAADNLNVAKRENSVILLEKNYKQTYAGFDPKSAESYIMFELMQDKYMANSVEMAKLIQSEVCATSGRVNKGVHQAGFLVIRETSMPSCLIELGFITTPDEEEYLNTQEGQDKMARGIYNAFVKYKKKYGHVKMNANNDQTRDDNEEMLLAMADHDPAIANNLDDRQDNGEKVVETRDVQQLITDDGAAPEPTEYTEQREVRRIFSEPAKVSADVPQPAPNPPKNASDTPSPTPNPPKSTPHTPVPAVTATAPESKPQKVEPAEAKNNTATQVPKTVPKTEPRKDTTPIEKTISESPKEPAKPAAEPKNEPVKEPAKPAAEPKNEPVKEPAKPAAEPKKEPVKEPVKPAAKPAADPKKELKDDIPVHGPVFKVQIAATSQDIPTSHSVFQGVENIESYQENGMFKYTVGASPDFDEISNLRKELLAKFPQAFIIAFKDGEKIDLARAIKEYKNIKNK
ncbi:MAG: N-acetylmuramoyl-L-alanine amidase [Prevotella sp.]|nr:N-acetylmuramoyl-L-alanine amidase [Prevotella sp.]